MLSRGERRGVLMLSWAKGALDGDTTRKRKLENLGRNETEMLARKDGRGERESVAGDWNVRSDSSGRLNCRGDRARQVRT